MIEGKHKPEAEEIKEVLEVVAKEVPALIKSIVATVFSEEAGRNMGKAAAAYYQELKNGGIPENIALKMTEDYMRTFTNLGGMLDNLGKRDWRKIASEDIEGEIEKRIKEKLAEKKASQKE